MICIQTNYSVISHSPKWCLRKLVQLSNKISWESVNCFKKWHDEGGGAHRDIHMHRQNDACIFRCNYWDHNFLCLCWSIYHYCVNCRIYWCENMGQSGWTIFKVLSQNFPRENVESPNNVSQDTLCGLRFVFLTSRTCYLEETIFK